MFNRVFCSDLFFYKNILCLLLLRKITPENQPVFTTDSKDKLKKTSNTVIAIIVVIGLLIGLLAVFGVFDTRTEVEKWEDNAKGALEEYMEFHGMIRD